MREALRLGGEVHPPVGVDPDDGVRTRDDLPEEPVPKPRPRQATEAGVRRDGVFPRVPVSGHDTRHTRDVTGRETADEEPLPVNDLGLEVANRVPRGAAPGRKARQEREAILEAQVRDRDAPSAVGRGDIPGPAGCDDGWRRARREQRAHEAIRAGLDPAVRVALLGRKVRDDYDANVATSPSRTTGRTRPRNSQTMAGTYEKNR